MRKPLFVLVICSSAVGAQPITVTGHAWAPFISPMGEPFRARTETDDTLARWFDQADRNHDGAITAEEMVDDAERFFATLDTDHDGQIDPDELSHYEWEIAPDIQVMTKTRRTPGQHAGAAERTDEAQPDAVDPGQREHRRRGHREMDGSLALEGGLQGAARYGLLNMPEPVAAADADFDRAITLREFKAAAVERFKLLDRTHQGRLTLAELETIRSEQLAQVGKRKHRKDAPDPRLGNPLPPGS